MSGCHLAFIGTGGIGKSSVAKLVLHIETITSFFGNGRCFIQYDDISAGAMSFSIFIDRLADGLGLSTKTHKSIIWNLEFIMCLLVLDGAETFMESAGNDSDDIFNSIAEIGCLPNVQLLFTTRSRNIFIELSPTVIHFFGLDVESTRQTFRSIYIAEPVDSGVDDLLSKVDYHPLSIVLLARAAFQSRWSLKMLQDNFITQKNRVLDIGKRKNQSLYVTIELSFRIPTFDICRDRVIEIALAVAFFPTGIQDSDICDMFSDVTNISTILDHFCQISLADRVDGSQLYHVIFQVNCDSCTRRGQYDVANTYCL
jgi:hypothetical protein